MRELERSDNAHRWPRRRLNQATLVAVRVRASELPGANRKLRPSHRITVAQVVDRGLRSAGSMTRDRSVIGSHGTELTIRWYLWLRRSVSREIWSEA